MFRIFIASPLEAEYVDRIAAVAPDKVEVLYRPDLLPPTRYVADHNGIDGFTLDDAGMQEWSRLLAQADALWDFPLFIPEGMSITEAAPNVRWIQTTSSGVGPRAKRLGLDETDIVITTARGVHAKPLAEYAFMAMLTHVKELARIQRDQQARRWERYCSDELDGKTLAIIGPGQIGRQVAKIGRAFGMQTLALASRGGDERRAELGVDKVYSRSQLHEMLSAADVVVLSCPHTPETEGMIDASALNAMRDGVILINIARGPVVVEADLVAALESGKVGFAALDVFTTEPLPADSPFWGMKNVMVSAHSGSTAFSENGKITDIFCHNLACFLDGRWDEMRNVLDKARLY